MPGRDVWFGGTKLMWETYGAIPLLTGIIAAAVSAGLAVKWLVSYLQSHGLAVLGWYRIILAVIFGLVRQRTRPSLKITPTPGHRRLSCHCPLALHRWPRDRRATDHHE